MAIPNKEMNIFSITICLFLMLVAAQELEPISPDIAYAPTESDQLSLDADQPILSYCASKTTPACGEQVFMGIIKDLPISSNCCVQIYNMGQYCHDTLVRIVLSQPQYRASASQALPKSDIVWNMCSLVATGEVAAPAPGISLEDLPFY